MIDVGIVLPLTTADMNSHHIGVIVIRLANLVFQVIFEQRMNSFMNRFEGGTLPLSPWRKKISSVVFDGLPLKLGSRGPNIVILIILI